MTLHRDPDVDTGHRPPSGTKSLDRVRNLLLGSSTTASAIEPLQGVRHRKNMTWHQVAETLILLREICDRQGVPRRELMDYASAETGFAPGMLNFMISSYERVCRVFADPAERNLVLSASTSAIGSLLCTLKEYMPAELPNALEKLRRGEGFTKKFRAMAQKAASGKIDKRALLVASTQRAKTEILLSKQGQKHDDAGTSNRGKPPRHSRSRVGGIAITPEIMSLAEVRPACSPAIVPAAHKDGRILVRKGAVARSPELTPAPRPFPAQQPRALTIAQKGQVRDLLELHFDAEKGMYAGGWSDQKVAEAVDVPRASVSQIRDVSYGPILVTPEMQALVERHKALKGEIDQAQADIRSTEEKLSGQRARETDLLVQMRELTGQLRRMGLSKAVE